MLCRRVVINGHSNCITEFSAWICKTAQDSCSRPSAFLSPLPGYKHSFYVALKFRRINPAHINDVWNVQNHADIFKSSADSFEGSFFIIIQVPAAFFSHIVLVFASRTSDYVNCLWIVCATFFKNFFWKGHFLLAPGLSTPGSATVIIGILLNPVAVGFCKHYIYVRHWTVRKWKFQKRVYQSCCITYMYGAAWTCSWAIPVLLTAAKNCHIILTCKGEDTFFVFKKYCTFFRSPANCFCECHFFSPV